MDIENIPFFLKLKRTNSQEDFLYEIQNKIIKENFNLTKLNYFNRFLPLDDEFNQKNWNMCLQLKIDNKRLNEMDHFENDEIFKVGVQIAHWYNFSIKVNFIFLLNLFRFANFHKITLMKENFNLKVT